MTFETAADAPERTHREVEKLHELAVNEFGYDPEHVLFTAHGDGTISGRIAFYAAGDHHDYDHDEDEETDRTSDDRLTETWDTDRDPDPPGVGAHAGISPSSTDATSDTAGASA